MSQFGNQCHEDYNIHECFYFVTCCSPCHMPDSRASFFYCEDFHVKAIKIRCSHFSDKFIQSVLTC